VPATTADPFALDCPACLSRFDPTDPAVEVDFGAGLAADAVCPRCGARCRHPGRPGAAPVRPARPVLVSFDRLTDAHLRAAEAVSAVDALRPDAELRLRAAPGGSPRVLRVVVGPAYRDEQVSSVRRRLAAIDADGAPGRGAARLI
jgi:hypothetical protein